jgi:hypothetical protein
VKKMMTPTTTCCALVTLGPACITLAVALLLGVDPRAAAYGSLGAGAIGFFTGLAQHRLVGEGLTWALGGQLAALLLRLVLALIALLLARSAGIGEAAVVCMALPLAAAVVGDAALLARASARLDLMAEDPTRA